MLEVIRTRSAARSSADLMSGQEAASVRPAVTAITATAANGIVPILAVTLGPSSSPGAFVGASRQRQRSRLARHDRRGHRESGEQETAQALGESMADLGVSRDDSCSATHLGDE